jgi:SEC-C motif-containing protein
MLCPCGSGKSKEECCIPLFRGERQAKTATELMRSRYAAFALGEIDYIVNSHHPRTRDEVDREGATEWSKKAEWQGFDVVSSEGGGEKDEKGVVEFVARYTIEHQEARHHERAEFERQDGVWYFVDGQPVKAKPVTRDAPKVGRNDPCPCGSGKKHKRCCG